jgi:hypothetical protein
MAYREVTAPDGRTWKVWDTHPSANQRVTVPVEYVAGWLSFASEGETRRLIPIPTAWDTASVPELLRLLGKAQPIIRRLPLRTEESG